MKDTVPDNKVLLDCAMIDYLQLRLHSLEGVLARRSELFQLCFQVLLEQFLQLCFQLVNDEFFQLRFHLFEGVVTDFGHIRRRLCWLCAVCWKRCLVIA